MTPHETADRGFEQRMLRYALAAGAALACQVPAHGEVIFTPSYLKLDFGFSRLGIDLDHDGSFDFIISETGSRQAGRSSFAHSLIAFGNHVWDRVASMGGQAAAFKKPQVIDGKGLFEQERVMVVNTYYVPTGYFANASNRYLGVAFLINGEVHYGWIGFRTVTAIGRYQINVQFGGWAYETEPKKGIVAGDRGNAPQTATMTDRTSLETLAEGHTGIDERKRRTSSER